MASRRLTRIQAAALVLCTAMVAPQPVWAGKKWQGQIPKVAEKTESWQDLVPALMDQGMYYGALASSHRMLSFFSDLASKELAFGTIIRLVDLGYPFSTRSYFTPGDLSPTTQDAFAQSYYLYKALVNVDKKMTKWAEYYFTKVDQANFAKYQFYLALDAYQNNKVPEAMDFLKKVLTQTTAPEDRNLAAKAARTLARLYYETGEFDKALDIYQNFLLRLNPVNPADWLEASWSLYRLNRFEDALGMLYNLESKSSDQLNFLEKYVVRALIFREYCSVENTESLLASFNAEFGKVIDGIKMGEPLASFPLLHRIDHPETAEYRQIARTLEELEIESARIPNLPRKLRALAKHLYATEIRLMQQKKNLYEDQALEVLARHLVILGESLRFLRFDVAREKFNPDRVFATPATSDTTLVEEPDEKTFRLHWLQYGDFWRDERLLFKGVLKNKCLL